MNTSEKFYARRDMFRLIRQWMLGNEEQSENPIFERIWRMVREEFEKKEKDWVR